MNSRLVTFSLGFSFLLFASGCGRQAPATPSIPVPGSAIRGRLYGGQQPVIGATIQLYAASTMGDGASSIPLLSSIVKSDVSGQFSISGQYACPSPGSLVYLVATGGNPGMSPGTNNSALSLMAALGSCSNLTSSTYISVNEATTVASVWPLAPFMSSYTGLGSSSSDVQQLAAAFAKMSELIDVSTGAIPGPTMPAGYTAPVAEINTLANILASCVNSAGGVAGDGSPCGNLFSKTAPLAGPAPTETIGAALQMAKNPASNVVALFNQANAAAPFQAALTSPPAIWDVSIQPNSAVGIPERENLLAEYLLNEGKGTVAQDTSGSGNDGSISGAAWEGTTDLNFATPGAYIQTPVPVNQANTWQFAIYSPPFGSATYPQPPGYGQPGDFGFNPSILCGTDTAHTCLVSTSYSGVKSFRLVPLFQPEPTEASTPLSAGWHIVTLVGGQNGQLDHYYFDGVEVSYANQGSGLFMHPATGNYQIGGSSIYSGTWFVGKIAAVWAWSTSLTASEAQMASQSGWNYIKSKGAAPAYLPNTHTTPLIIGGIDSRTAGLGLNLPWIDNLVLTDPSYTTLNFGFPGATAFDHLAMFDALEGMQIATNTAPTIAIFWGGVNDFAAGMSSTTIANSLKGLVQKAKADGARVVLATEISSNSGGNGDASKNALNTIIRSQAFSWGVDNIADLATIPQLGADGAYASTVYFADGLHPSDAGEAYITAVMSNAINELIGSTPANPHTSSASIYQEVAGDGYLNLIGTSAQTVMLPSCIGYLLQRQITNYGSKDAAVITVNGESLSGNTVLSAGATAVFAPAQGPLNKGGCSWIRSQ